MRANTAPIQPAIPTPLVVLAFDILRDKGQPQSSARADQRARTAEELAAKIIAASEQGATA